MTGEELLAGLVGELPAPERVEPLVFIEDGRAALSCVSNVLMFPPIFCARRSSRSGYRLAMSELAAGSPVPASGAAGLAFGAWALRTGGLQDPARAGRGDPFLIPQAAP